MQIDELMTNIHRIVSGNADRENDVFLSGLHFKRIVEIKYILKSRVNRAMLYQFMCHVNVFALEELL